MICFLSSILGITMLELYNKASSNPLTEVFICCTKLLSKACVDQDLEILVYVCDEAQIYKNCSCYSHALACHINSM